MTSAADVSYSDVQLGSWMDRSKGPVHGANVTVTSTNGVILVAFIALFVQFAGQHLWGIASFVWHQLRVSHRAKTALQYQQDASLRNNGSPGQTLWHFLQIAWTWRHTRRHRRGWWWLAAVPILIPLLFQCLLTATGILSSVIVETSDVEILLRGDKCGIWQTPSQEMILAADNEFMVENQRWMGGVTEFSRIYARTCYNNSATADSPTCQAFTQTSIPYSSRTNASCPFDTITCSSPNGNLQMDTGELDTNKVLGINTGKDNVMFRKVTTCAHLKPDLYTRTINETGPNGESGYHVYWDWGTLTWNDGYDYIAEARNYTGQPWAGYTMITPRHYLVDPRLDFPDQSSFMPRAEFNVSDGDIFMLFLSAHDMVFAAPCDDPWFSAHDVAATDYNRTEYRSDHLLNPVGCVEQFTFCNPHGKGSQCTPLGGILPAAAAAKEGLGLSTSQSAIVDIIVNAIYGGNAGITQPVSLLASNTAWEGVQLPLPKNQWVFELQDMHNRALTSLQRMIVDYARGPGSASAQQFLTVPNEAFRELCGLVRAKTNARFSNVNTYGLVVTVTLGTLVILTNMFLVDIVSAIQKWRKIDSFKRKTWIADGLFQLHKTNLDTDSLDPWKNLDKSVPTTQRCGLVARRPYKELPESLASTPQTASKSAQLSHQDLEAVIEMHEVAEEGTAMPRAPVSVALARMEQSGKGIHAQSKEVEEEQSPVSPMESSANIPTFAREHETPSRGV